MQIWQRWKHGTLLRLEQLLVSAQHLEHRLELCSLLSRRVHPTWRQGAWVVDHQLCRTRNLGTLPCGYGLSSQLGCWNHSNEQVWLSSALSVVPALTPKSNKRQKRQWHRTRVESKSDRKFSLLSKSGSSPNSLSRVQWQRLWHASLWGRSPPTIPSACSWAPFFIIFWYGIWEMSLQ